MIAKAVETITVKGRRYDWSIVVTYMDDEVREDLHSELSPCTPQEFFEAYCGRYMARYNEDFWGLYGGALCPLDDEKG